MHLLAVFMSDRITSAVTVQPTFRLQRGLSFIGRAAELATALGLQEEARDVGRSAVVLVHGEPGIGKSRLVSEIANRLTQSGTRVLLGQCEESLNSLAFHPFKEAFAGLTEAADTLPTVQGVVQANPELARLFSDQASTLEFVPPAIPINPLNEPYRLYESVTALLAEVAQGSPGGLFLCIEDIHWADESSLALLRHLGRRLGSAPVLLLLTYRDSDLEANAAAGTAIEALMRLETTKRIVLNRWVRDEVREYLESTVRPFPPPTIIDTVLSHSGGNPFFVKVLVEDLQQSDRLLDSAGAWQLDLNFPEGELPADALLITNQILRHASTHCREILLAASILGKAFETRIP